MVSKETNWFPKEPYGSSRFSLHDFNKLKKVKRFISVETRLKIRATLLGHRQSENTKLKRSKSLLGLKRSEKTKQNTLFLAPHIEYSLLTKQ
jgi:hypothetical protein